VLSDRTLRHLRDVADLPDLSETKYRLVRPIARGGMGAVFLVEDADLDRSVALKVLSLPDPDGGLSARLFDEARLLARLDHPNLVPVHDVGRLPDGRVYYVMKAVEGATLDVFAASARPAVRLRLFRKICTAVAFAHAKGVLHRDLKPENVLVDAFGEPFVMDWGLAKRLGDVFRTPVSGTPSTPRTGSETTGPPSRHATAHGTVMGTPAYMAPEQAAGIVDLDERADVYALGGILFFLLTGRPPVDGADRGAAPTPRAIAPAVPRPLDSICRKALSREPGDRYATAAEMADDVDRFLDGLPVGAHRETWLERIGRVFRKNRTIAYLVLAYLLLRILVILWTGR
jgi:serine/threonine protein kinase